MKIRGNTVGTTLRPEKAIVKSKNLTEEEKAQARKNLGVDAIPTVTKADAGKFLRVNADGKWAAETIRNAEEVAY